VLAGGGHGCALDVTIASTTLWYSLSNKYAIHRDEYNLLNLIIIYFCYDIQVCFFE
jgi:hypothetical protein